MRCSKRPNFSVNVLQTSLWVEQPQQLVGLSQASAGGDEGGDVESTHGVVDGLELPLVVPVKAADPDPLAGRLADKDPGEWLWAFAEAVGVIYKHRGVREIVWRCEPQRADLDLQLDQCNGVWRGAEVLPGIMVW